MNEVRAIIEAYEGTKRNGTRAALATVVRTSGSVYRRAGARMLIAIGDDACTVTGAISGGCLSSTCASVRAVFC